MCLPLVWCSFTGKGIALRPPVSYELGQHVVMDLRVGLYDHMQNLSAIYIRQAGRRADVAHHQRCQCTANMVTTVIVDLVVQGITFEHAWVPHIYQLASYPYHLCHSAPDLSFLTMPPKLRFVGHAIQEELARLSAIIQEALSAIRIVRSFVTEAMESPTL